MKQLVTGLALLAAVWLQIGLLPAWRPAGVVPGLYLVVAYGLLARWPDTETLAYVIGGGLLLDLLAGSDFGLRTAFYAAFGLAMLMLRQAGLELRQAEWGALIVAVTSLLYEGALLASLAIAHIGWRLAAVGRTVGLEVLANLVLYVVLRLVARRFLRSASSSELSLMSRR